MFIVRNSNTCEHADVEVRKICLPYSLILKVFLLFSFQHFQKVIPHQFDSGPDKVIQAAYQVKYNAKKMKK